MRLFTGLLNTVAITVAKQASTNSPVVNGWSGTLNATFW